MVAYIMSKTKNNKSKNIQIMNEFFLASNVICVVYTRHLYGLCHFDLIKTVHIIKIEASSRASRTLTCVCVVYLVDWTRWSTPNYHYNKTITLNSDSVERVLYRVDGNFNHTLHTSADLTISWLTTINPC